MRHLRVPGLSITAIYLSSLLGCGGNSLPAGSYTLSVSPATLSVQAGSSGQVSVLATPSGGYTTPVAVALTGVPAGASASPASLVLQPGTARTVTLTASTSAVAGNAALTFTGKSGTLTQSAAETLTRSATATSSSLLW